MSDDAELIASVLDGVQDLLRDWLVGGIVTLKDRPESWGFTGARIIDALKLVRMARQATPSRSPRFLECGSGFGFIGALARELGFTVTGLEIEPKYIKMSRRLFPSVRIEEADLLTFDRYDEFDVVYYYGRSRTTTFKPGSNAASRRRCGPVGSLWPVARSRLISARTAPLKCSLTTGRKLGLSKRNDHHNPPGRGLRRELHAACCRVFAQSPLHLGGLVILFESEQHGGQSQEKCDSDLPFRRKHSAQPRIDTNEHQWKGTENGLPW